VSLSLIAALPEQVEAIFNGRPGACKIIFQRISVISLPFVQRLEGAVLKYFKSCEV
jgi:hypothetical protein